MGVILNRFYLAFAPVKGKNTLVKTEKQRHLLDIKTTQATPIMDFMYELLPTDILF